MANPKRATVYFDPDIHRALRLRAAASDKSISDMVNEAVKLTLAEDAEDLAALDERIKTAVSVGFMKSDGYQIRRHVINSTGLTFHLVGLFRYLDLPDIAALIAPRPVLFINGSRDTLFNQEGLKAAYQKIGQCYEKAGAPSHQVCRLYDAPHQFNAEMQAEAWQFFRKWL